VKTCVEVSRAKNCCVSVGQLLSSEVVRELSKETDLSSPAFEPWEVFIPPDPAETGVPVDRFTELALNMAPPSPSDSVSPSDLQPSIPHLPVFTSSSVSKLSNVINHFGSIVCTGQTSATSHVPTKSGQERSISRKKFQSAFGTFAVNALEKGIRRAEKVIRGTAISWREETA